MGVAQPLLATRARAPRLNLVVAEIKLELGPSRQTMAATPLWLEENGLADALSRVPEGKAVPAELTWASRRRSLETRTWRFVGAESEEFERR